MLNSDHVKRLALEVGFDACGIARADRLSDDEYPLRQWLARGWNAGMGYMERNVDMRLDPRLLVPGAQSVICLVSAYPPPALPLSKGESPEGGRGSIPYAQGEPPEGLTAAFALSRDYHRDLKAMLFALRDRLGIEAKPCCDTVPISDKHWAARAGLGVIGRHTLLITPRWGTWVNLAELVTTEPCDRYDTPLKIQNPELKIQNSKFKIQNPPSCEGCNRCVAACPNHALAPAGPPMLDARRCTSYYTTPRPRPLPPGLDTRGYTYGCDLCQLACPHNQIPTPAT